MLLLVSILVVIFIAKDNLIRTEKITQNYYHQYLKRKFNLMKTRHQDKNTLCQFYKKEEIKINISGQIFALFCKKKTIFKIKPTTKKYISFNNIHQYLDIASYQNSIIYIQSLADLPKTSRSNPSIVIAMNPIDGKLTRNFYGILITNYFFDITGKKFYGKLYSSYDNQREERNLSYNKTVIKNIQKKYALWRYIPHSQHLLHEKE
ncbi:Protein of uncharacterised function (DUF2572) [Phocoenobacter uteri]|uniref:Protein of uncharacterized function (DUF2572) n=2 Tax=Phocoenobacter uteri TaxID=146806 RepID=A0A379CBF7_9PAST|nr:hypothetical protein [Phocoenobacter uteri]SUB59468.1 Protein of uncharacterised function (DUF2572) [Phocoenobacter uteri]